MYELEEKSKIIDGYKLKSKGVFNFEELYTEMAKWFKHYDYNWKEIEYKKIDNQDNTQTVEIRWECPKEIDNYVSILTEIFLKATDLSNVEVTVGNEKKMMNKGSVELKFTTTMIKNINIWTNKPFGKAAGLIYDKILIKDRLTYYEDEIFNESQKLIAEIKEYLQIYAR
ncbi:MAG: hypothetical protein V1914_00080 [archaeon]